MKNIWISGSINSGKSAVAKVLAKELKMAVIELDILATFVEDWMSFDEYLKLNYSIVPEIVETYNKKNISVVIVYPIGEVQYGALKDALKNITYFTIDPSFEIAVTNRGERSLTDWEKDRIRYHYDNNIHNPAFATRIDTKDKNVEETKNEILTILAE